MPQTFQVWRCYKCLVFQVHQTKKSNKWQCKLCGEKQSIKRHYGIGTAKECRLHVQKLNTLRGEKDESSMTVCDSDDEDNATDNIENINRNELNKYNSFIDKCTKKDSKWSEFIEKSDGETEDTEPEKNNLDNVEVVLELPMRKRKFKCLRTTIDKSKLPVNAGQDETPANHTGSSQTFNSNGNHSMTGTIISSTYEKSKNNGYFDKTDSEPYASKVKKEFKVPIIKDNSKWAQFVEDDEVNCESETDNSESNLKDFTDKDYFDNKYLETTDRSFYKQISSDDTSQYQDEKKNEKASTLFEMCDDDELDSVLDI